MKVAVFNAGTPTFEQHFDHIDSVHDIGFLHESDLQRFDVVVLNGYGHEGPYQLSYEMADKLWKFAESGGIVYGELLKCDDFPSSRLFGFKQDFSHSFRRMEKLSYREPFNQNSSNLLEWQGPFLTGFALSSTVILDIDVFGETHHTAREGKYPGLSVIEHGKGKVIFSALSLFSTKEPWALRPHWLWNHVIETLNRLGLPCLPLKPWIITQEQSIETAVKRSVKWFESSSIMPCEDGSKGVYENIHSLKGTVSMDIRPDCNVQSALMFHLYGTYTQDGRYHDKSCNILNYLFEHGYQDVDPNSPTYGFWKWFQVPYEKPEQIFSDDNGWVAFVLLYLYRKTGIERYKERGMLTIQALLQTQHVNGLRCEQINRKTFLEKGRKEFVETQSVSMNPHFESIVHAAYIQAYLVSNDKKYLDIALKGTLYLLDHMDDLKFMYSKTSGYNRFLLALSHLYTLTKSERVYKGLSQVLAYLQSHQHPLGAVEEADNPAPNRYGTEDTGVFRLNGEGIADLLYTNNFLAIHAWESWKATKSPKIYRFQHQVINFLTHKQISSPREEFDGGWFRAYHLDRQEYFGNNGDTGWGPYCMESGWTNGIITVGLLLNLLDISLLD